MVVVGIDTYKDTLVGSAINEVAMNPGPLEWCRGARRRRMAAESEQLRQDRKRDDNDQQVQPGHPRVTSPAIR